MTCAATARWARRLNAQGRRLDELAAGVHPSAWPELLALEREKWKRIAKSVP